MGSGGQLQVWRVVEGLAKQHEVCLVYVGEDGDAPNGVSRAVSLPDPSMRHVKKVLFKARALVGGDPYLVAMLRSSGVGDAVRSEITRFDPDVVYVTNGPMAFLGRELAGAATVLNAIDAWSLNEAAVTAGSTRVRRAYAALAVRGIERFERRTTSAFDVVMTVSDPDSERLRTMGATVVRTVPNGVDLEMFSRAGAPPEASTIIFHGTMSYPPNEEAALWLTDDIMPMVRHFVPGVRLLLAGREPSERLLARASDSVVVTGALPNIAEALRSAAVAVYPMRAGSGIKNKVLEAAAIGLPMVVTESARGDIPLADGHSALIRQDARSIADALVSLLRDAGARTRIGDAGREVVTKAYTWEATVVGVEESLGEAVSLHRPAVEKASAGRPPLFTVFTATYNRAHTLPRVYESLKRQTCRDFEWLIVDDGSDDGTSDLIAQWATEENDFALRYVWQDNAGKPAAWDRGVSEARGALFLSLDSDDECVPTALDRFAKLWADVPAAEREKFVGVTVNTQRRGSLIGTSFPSSPLDSDSVEIRFRYGVKGEKWGFSRTDVLRENLFGNYGDDRFISEDMVWFDIARSYKTRFVNEALREYITDEPGARLSALSEGVLAGRWGRSLAVVNDLSAWALRGSPEWWKAAVNYSRYSFDRDIPLATQLGHIRRPLVRGAVLALSPAGRALSLRDRQRMQSG